MEKNSHNQINSTLKTTSASAPCHTCDSLIGLLVKEKHEKEQISQELKFAREKIHIHEISQYEDGLRALQNQLMSKDAQIQQLVEELRQIKGGKNNQNLSKNSNQQANPSESFQRPQMVVGQSIKPSADQKIQLQVQQKIRNKEMKKNFSSNNSSTPAAATTKPSDISPESDQSMKKRHWKTLLKEERLTKQRVVTTGSSSLNQRQSTTKNNSVNNKASTKELKRAAPLSGRKKLNKNQPAEKTNNDGVNNNEAPVKKRKYNRWGPDYIRKTPLRNQSALSEKRSANNMSSNDDLNLRRSMRLPRGHQIKDVDNDIMNLSRDLNEAPRTKDLEEVKVKNPVDNEYDNDSSNSSIHVHQQFDQDVDHLTQGDFRIQSGGRLRCPAPSCNATRGLIQSMKQHVRDTKGLNGHDKVFCVKCDTVFFKQKDREEHDNIDDCVKGLLVKQKSLLSIRQRQIIRDCVEMTEMTTQIASTTEKVEPEIEEQVRDIKNEEEKIINNNQILEELIDV